MRNSNRRDDHGGNTFGRNADSLTKEYLQNDRRFGGGWANDWDSDPRERGRLHRDASTRSHNDDGNYSRREGQGYYAEDQPGTLYSGGSYGRGDYGRGSGYGRRRYYDRGSYFTDAGRYSPRFHERTEYDEYDRDPDRNRQDRHTNDDGRMSMRQDSRERRPSRHQHDDDRWMDEQGWGRRDEERRDEERRDEERRDAERRDAERRDGRGDRNDRLGERYTRGWQDRGMSDRNEPFTPWDREGRHEFGRPYAEHTYTPPHEGRNRHRLGRDRVSEDREYDDRFGTNYRDPDEEIYGQERREERERYRRSNGSERWNENSERSRGSSPGDMGGQFGGRNTW